MRHTTRENYHAFHWPDRSDWLTTDLCRRYPSLAIGHYWVNTSFDSGFLWLDEEQTRQGWFRIGDLAHSPRLESIDQIPHHQYDEWLVFDLPVRVNHFETFVNHLGFNPIDFDWEEKLESFWDQVIRLQPLHVIAGNPSSYIITRDENLAAAIQADQ